MEQDKSASLDRSPRHSLFHIKTILAGHSLTIPELNDRISLLSEGDNDVSDLNE